MAKRMTRFIAACLVLCFVAALFPPLQLRVHAAEALNVIDFGATGDGVTDDHAAIQSAIDAASAGEGGGVVTFPAGTYLAGDFIILKSNITLLLDDAATIVNGINYSIGPCIVFLTGPYTRGKAKQSWDGVENVTVKGGSIDMNGQLTTDGSGARNLTKVNSSGAFALGYSRNIHIENVTFLNSYKGHALQICACDGVTVKNCSFKGQALPNYLTDSQMDNLEMIRMEPASVNAFPYAANDTGEANRNVTIEGCYFGASDLCGEPSVAIGNHTQMAAAEKCHDITIQNNTFDNMRYAGVRFCGYEDVAIIGNTITGGHRGIEILNCTGDITLGSNHITGLADQFVRFVGCGDNKAIEFYTHGGGTLEVSTSAEAYTFTATPNVGQLFGGYYTESGLTNMVTADATLVVPVNQSDAVVRHALFKACGHSYQTDTKDPTCTEDGSTVYACGVCGYSYEESIPATGHSYEGVTTEPTEDAEGYTTYTCTVCGDSYVEALVQTASFKLAGANMHLGNTLDMNFFVNKSDLSGTDYYAEVTHYDADDTVTYNIPYEQWDNRSTKMAVTLDGLAARQMSDKFEVAIYRNDGTQVSYLWTDSIRGYVKRALESSSTSTKTKTLLVDMLNYGAAAQNYFGYKIGDLANNLLTEAQQAFASKEQSVTDERVKGTNYYGSSLVLKNRIILTMYFKNITTDMYAVVSYKDHKGTVYNTRVEGSAFVPNGSRYGVEISDLVVADGDQMVTVRVYDTAGNEVAMGCDSVNSYAARALSMDSLFERVAKFTAAAYAYFH